MIAIVPELAAESVSVSVDFYKNLFGAKLVESVPDEKGGMIWAEMDIFGSRIMFEEMNALASEFAGADTKAMACMRGCIVFRIESVDVAKSIYEKSKEMNLSLSMDWKETDYGTKEFGVYDPNGNILLVSSK